MMELGLAGLATSHEVRGQVCRPLGGWETTGTEHKVWSLAGAFAV